MIKYPDVRGCDREEYPHFPAQERSRTVQGSGGGGGKAPVSRGEAMPRRFPAVIGFECGPRSFFGPNSGGTTENLRPELSAQGVFLSPKTAPFSRKLQTKEFDRI